MITKTQIVWIFGPSGAGKGTIINNLISRENRWKFLVKKLDLNKNVMKSDESLKNDGRSSDRVKEEVIKLAKQKDVSILIKVQWEDIENRGIPKELRQEIPNAIHKILMLYTTPTEIVRRLGNDPRPNRRVSKEGQAKSHLKRMTRHVIDLQKDGFETIWVDSNNEEYNLISNSRS